MNMKDNQNLYIYSMGKRFRVTGIFTDTAAANKYMERTTDEGVIANFKNKDEEYIFVAEFYGAIAK